MIALAKHPVENMSVGELSYLNNSLHIKLRCLEEGLRTSLSLFCHRQIVLDYDQPAFSPDLLNSIELYLQSNLQVSINNQVQKLRLKSAYWVKNTQYSDHAAISIEVSFPSVPLSRIRSLQIRNTLLSTIPEQVNILNVSLKEDKQVLTFDKATIKRELTFKE
jgi:hypothetical protein